MIWLVHIINQVSDLFPKLTKVIPVVVHVSIYVHLLFCIYKILTHQVISLFIIVISHIVQNHILPQIHELAPIPN